jgi:thymidylate kinase
LGRYLKHRGENRPELADGCNEKIDLDFLKWIWNYPRDVKPEVMALLKLHADLRVILLRNARETQEFITNPKRNSEPFHQ